jgi:hypothetical protein
LRSGEQDFRVSIALGAEESLDAVEWAAELWDADWHRHGTGGRLELPVQAGLRRGTVTAKLSTEAEGDTTALVVHVESSHYRLQRAAVSILAIGGMGGLALTLWPLYPRLLALAPAALILVVVAWLVIASRLQNSGIEEFLDLVESGCAAGAEDGTENGNR